MASRRPPTDRAIKRTREIARAAAELFAEKGYCDTVMDDIAEAIGFSKPTLYHYVRSKAELLHIIHDELADMLIGALEQRLEGQPTAPEILRAVIVDIVGIMDSHPGHLRVYFEHFRETPPEYQLRARERRDYYFNLVREVVDKGMEDGEFARKDPRLTTLAFFGMVNWSYQWYIPGGGMSSSEIANYLWNTFYEGMKAPARVEPVSS